MLFRSNGHNNDGFGAIWKGPWNKGRTGYKTQPQSDETKRKSSETKKKNWADPLIKARRTASQNTPIVSAKRSASLERSWADPTVHAKRSKSNKDSRTPEVRAAISKKLKGISRAPLTEEHKQKVSSANIGRKANIVTCPHCNQEGGTGAMKRYHFDNCKMNGATRKILICPYCGFEGTGGGIRKYHFNNCKHK